MKRSYNMKRQWVMTERRRAALERGTRIRTLKCIEAMAKQVCSVTHIAEIADILDEERKALGYPTIYEEDERRRAELDAEYERVRRG